MKKCNIFYYSNLGICKINFQNLRKSTAFCYSFSRLTNKLLKILHPYVCWGSLLAAPLGSQEANCTITFICLLNHWSMQTKKTNRFVDFGKLIFKYFCRPIAPSLSGLGNHKSISSTFYAKKIVQKCFAAFLYLLFGFVIF